MSKNHFERGNFRSSKDTRGKEKPLFVQVPLEVLEARISTSAMKLYLILLKYARQSNECWPSQQTLGRDMNLKPRRIADLLKELEVASLITIICRSKEGLSNLYRLLKVVLPKGGSGTSLPKTTGGTAKKDIPGKQRMSGEGLQDIADESHAVEKHALRTHIHIQGDPTEEMVPPTNVQFYQLDRSVCGLRNFGEEIKRESTGSQNREESVSLHIPQSQTQLEKVVTALIRFGVAKPRAKQLGSTVVEAKLDEEYVRNLVEWIETQATSRPIHNPAGLLVQMVHQLAPVPSPKGMGVKTLSGLQREAEAKSEYFDKHLPRLIAIEERNLTNALSERDRASIKLRLDKYLALQARKGIEESDQVCKLDLAVLRAIDDSQTFFMEPSYLQKSAKEGRFIYATTD